MPCSCGLEWRLQLFSRYYDDNETEGAEVLLCIPFILYNNPSTVNTLIDNLLHPALSSRNLNVQTVVPGVISNVLCILSGAAQLHRYVL